MVWLKMEKSVIVDLIMNVKTLVVTLRWKMILITQISVDLKLHIIVRLFSAGNYNGITVGLQWLNTFETMKICLRQGSLS